jgi:2-iminobutanoate/2-iminopropanoate deaminase
LADTKDGIFILASKVACSVTLNGKTEANVNLKFFNMKKIIKTTAAPAPIGPYNQAILVENTLYISGQIPLNPETGELIENDIKKETDQCMKNLQAVLKAADMDFSHVVKSSIFVADMHQFAAVNEVYGAYFDEATAPARETVEVANLPKFVNVEISMIAVK